MRMRLAPLCRTALVNASWTIRKMLVSWNLDKCSDAVAADELDLPALAGLLLFDERLDRRQQAHAFQDGRVQAADQATGLLDAVLQELHAAGELHGRLGGHAFRAPPPIAGACGRP